MGRQMDAGKAAGMSHPYVNTLHAHPSKTSLKATTAWPSCHSRGPQVEHPPLGGSANESGTWTLCSAPRPAQLFFVAWGVGCALLKQLLQP